jgi:hypothetical protein
MYEPADSATVLKEVLKIAKLITLLYRRSWSISCKDES